MEPAKIDWKRLEWKFVEDEVYENINAPKWVDLLAPDESVDDEAWFCKPDCKHPKTVDDYLRSTPSKLFSPVQVPEALPLGDQNRRDANLKKRVPTPSSASSGSKLRFNQDSQNQNPNMSTPTKNPLKPMKAAIKSSEEKKPIDDTSQTYKAHPLKSTLSAKNLFAGRPILNQITEFCNELKKLATGTRERVNTENFSARKSEEGAKEKMASTPIVQPLDELDKREKERKPLLEVGKTEMSEGSNAKVKQQRRIIRHDEAENMPISLDVENVRHKKEESLLRIRTNPPSPQCFSANRGPNKTTPLQASKSCLMERGILQEVEQNKLARDSLTENSRSIATVDVREGRALDVLWFLKPCTLSG